MKEYTQRINKVLEHTLASADIAEPKLRDAMHYSALGSGKRMRPQLVYATGQLLDLPVEKLDALAAAAELVHAYSLVHDDLPAMDDDDLRRGQPTTHIAFDPATAILAGDALQTLAFDVLAHDAILATDPARQIRVIGRLSAACGAAGMVGGQALDMQSEGRDITQAELEAIHNRKTGALLRACVLMPAALAPGLGAAIHDALDRFATRIGLAFQVRDDVLDVESSTETLGKTQGADIAHDKATYPALLGLEAAKAYANRLFDEASTALNEAGADDGAPIRELARAIIARDR